MQLFHLICQIAECTVHLRFSRRNRCNVELTAKCRFFFKQNNLMTFYTCNSRCFHTCNSTADHNYFFLLIGRSDRSLILISVFRIEYAA